MICLGVLVLWECAAQTKTTKADWENPNHRLVGEQLASLLRAAGRDPMKCKLVFIETDALNAVSLGECAFGFTNGLASTGDARLIAGVGAHEVAHEVLGHADKRKAAVAARQVLGSVASLIPGVGGLIASGVVLAAGVIGLPAYSRM